MESIRLEDFTPLAKQLRQMEVDTSQGRVFPELQYRAVNSTIQYLKKKDGLAFTTRKRNGNLYVWRIK